MLAMRYRTSDTGSTAIRAMRFDLCIAGGTWARSSDGGRTGKRTLRAAAMEVF